MLFKLKHIFMRVVSSTLVRSSGIYTISNVILAAISFLMLPILTQRLSAADYGVVAMFQLVVSAIYPFIGMNLDGAIGRKYYDKDGGDFSSYIGSCFILISISLVFVGSLFLGFDDYIQEISQIPKLWLKYCLLVAACQIIASIVLVVFQVKVQPLRYSILQISQSIVNVGLTILLVVVMNKNWEGRLEAQITTGIIFAIVSFAILLGTKQIKLDVKKKDMQEALKFGVPLIPHAVGGILFLGIDRFFLTKLIGLEQTGNYTVAYQIGTIVFLITSAFNNAYVPWLFEHLNQSDLETKTKIVKFTYLYFLLINVGAILLLLLFPIIVSIFVRGAFHSINTYSVFIVFGFVFQGMYFMVTNYIAYAKKTHIQAAITISVGLLKLPITYFAIIWFGAVGASISYCLTFFLFFVITWIYSNRVYSMPWNILNAS